MKPWTDQQYVSLKQIALATGIDRSNIRKWIQQQGFTFQKARTPDSRQQIANVLTVQDANNVIERRKQFGFGMSPTAKPLNSGVGVFYVVQVIPEVDELRIKLGFTVSIQSRLGDYHTITPTAVCFAMWASKSTWERAATDSITRIGCKHIANEVYKCCSLEDIKERGDRFFDLMPPLV